MSLFYPYERYPLTWFRPRSVELLCSGSTSVSTVVVATDITYTLTVTNSGDADATGVTLTDILPGSLALVSNPDGGDTTTVPGQIYWNGGTATVTFTVRVD